MPTNDFTIGKASMHKKKIAYCSSLFTHQYLKTVLITRVPRFVVAQREGDGVRCHHSLFQCLRPCNEWNLSKKKKFLLLSKKIRGLKNCLIIFQLAAKERLIALLNLLGKRATLMIMMRVLLSFCLLAQLLTAVNCKSLRKVKSNAGKNEFIRKELRPLLQC